MQDLIIKCALVLESKTDVFFCTFLGTNIHLKLWVCNLLKFNRSGLARGGSVTYGATQSSLSVWGLCIKIYSEL